MRAKLLVDKLREGIGDVADNFIDASDTPLRTLEVVIRLMYPTIGALGRLTLDMHQRGEREVLRELIATNPVRQQN